MKINFTRAELFDSACSVYQWSLMLKDLLKESGLSSFDDDEFSSWLKSNYEIRLLHEAEYFTSQISGLEMSEATHLMMVLRYSRG